MHYRNLTENPQQRRFPVLNLYRNSVLLAIIASLLPTLVLLVISYLQSMTYARETLEGVVNRATIKTNQLLKDADAILHRSKIDLQDADAQTASKILQRQIYNDFRFREANLLNPEGLLIVSSLGVVDPPLPPAPTTTRFDPNNPDLQVLGLTRTRLMQEQSIVLTLPGSGKISALYLLVDPAILRSFIEVTPNQDLGPNGFVAFVTPDQQVLSSTGTIPQGDLANLHPSPRTIQVDQTTQNGDITIVGQVDRRWALRFWVQELVIGAPLTILISGLIGYLFIRQMRQVNRLDDELKWGLTQNQFEVHYQPIMDLETRQCIGAEALLRWRHPQRGLIYPSLFIPIAEQTGLILPLTEWLLEQVLRDQITVSSKFPDLYTSINLSPTQLNISDVDRLIQPLSDSRARARILIIFEITENRLIEEQGETVQDAIARLKRWGARLAIDDFGTGYSNIGYLKRLDVDQLKLDQLFIKGLEVDVNIAHIVDSLIDLGNRLELTLVAEGIETEAQCQYLRDRNVRYGQGWLFSRPLPFAEFERFLQAQDTASDSSGVDSGR